VKRLVLIFVAVLALAVAGGASAYGVKKIMLKPGHCKTIKKAHVKVCAKKVKPTTKTVTETQTVTQTVTTTPTPATAFSDGTYVVGTQVVAGTYETVNAVSSDGLCYWARLSGFSGTLDDIIANDDVFSGHAIVTIASTDVGFQSSGCGPWTKIG